MHITMMHLVLTWQVATYIDLQQVELVLNRVRLVKPMMMILNSVEMPVLVLNHLEKFSQTRLLVFAELLVQVEDISRVVHLLQKKYVPLQPTVTVSHTQETLHLTTQHTYSIFG
jgi:hypothetical protein